MTPLIELEHIGKRYGSTTALSDISLRCGGGVTGLLGPNGAGKSTLIKILMGLVKPTAGTGRVLDYVLGKHSRSIRSVVGYMPEDDCYIAGLTGVEMVRFSSNLAGLPYLEGLRRSHEILDFSGVGQERYRLVDTYSTGMRQKVKFAAAIVHDPKLLILDEPTSGLDPEERLSLLSRIRVLAGEHGKAVLLSTHILPDVQNVCGNVIIVSDGRLKISDTLQNLNRTASPAVHIKFFSGLENASNEFARRGLSVRLENSSTLIVSDDRPDLAQRAYQICIAAELPIQSLVPGRTSLEQVFISAVKESMHANS